MIAKALQREEHAAANELRTLETRRLDALQASVWDRAMDGDLAAAAAALRIIAARCRLMGLDARVLLDQEARPRTVVVPPTE
jgi:hypothetical protein